MYLYIQTRKQFLKEEGRAALEEYDQYKPGFAAYVELWASDEACTKASATNQAKYESMSEALTKAGVKYDCFSDDCDWAMMWPTSAELAKIKRLFKKYN